jgi:hypothetical protein
VIVTETVSWLLGTQNWIALLFPSIFNTPRLESRIIIQWWKAQRMILCRQKMGISGPLLLLPGRVTDFTLEGPTPTDACHDMALPEGAAQTVPCHQHGAMAVQRSGGGSIHTKYEDGQLQARGSGRLNILLPLYDDAINPFAHGKHKQGFPFRN